MLTIIVALDQNNGLGYRGGMPWRIKEESLHFRNTTLNHKIIMGDTTFIGMGKPLKDRKTIVASIDPNFSYEHPDVTIEHDLFKVLKEFENSEEEVFVCGGKTIYELSLPFVSRLLISRVKGTYITDTSLNLDLSEFDLISEEEHDEFTVMVYQRKKGLL